MKNIISASDYNSLNKKTKSSNTLKKTRTYYDRLNDAISSGFSFKKDEYKFENETLIFSFLDVAILSHNDILRINFKKLYPYIKLWKERVKNTASKIPESQSDYFLNKEVKIEFLFKTKTEKKLDYDSSVACSKFIIDGLVESNILIDDVVDIVPLILTKQIKNKIKENTIIVIISEVNQLYMENLFSETLKNNLN